MTDNINKKLDNEAVDVVKLNGVSGGMKLVPLRPHRMPMCAEAPDAPTNGKLSLEEINNIQTSDAEAGNTYDIPPKMTVAP